MVYIKYPEFIYFKNQAFSVRRRARLCQPVYAIKKELRPAKGETEFFFFIFPAEAGGLFFYYHLTFSQEGSVCAAQHTV